MLVQTGECVPWWREPKRTRHWQQRRSRRDTFDWEIELSKLFARISGARETMKGLTIFYFDSTDFTIEWLQTKLASKTHTKSWQAHRVGVAIVGQASLETGSLDVAMATDPREAVIKIKSNSPGQVAIQALEYELLPAGRGKT